MTVRERQERRLQGNTPYGRQVVSANQGPPPPLRDVPTNDPSPGEDLPFPPGLAEAFDAAAGRPPPLPVLRSTSTAYLLAEKLRTEGRAGMGEEAYARGLKMLTVFNQTYPNALAEYSDQVRVNNWVDENVDATPHKSSRLTRAQREAQSLRLRAEGQSPTIASMEAAKSIPIPKSIKDLPPLEPGSRAAVLEREEAAGLDTTSGVTSFVEQLNLARKVNGSNAQFNLIYAMVKDKLEQAGHTLPKGLHPVNFNEDLGQLEALVPTEDGKVRRVLVDPEFFRPQDFGSAADIEELMAMTGAVLSQIPGAGASQRILNKLAARHPALAEFTGDFGWRNTGLVLEAILDAEALGGDTTMQDLVDALENGGNFGESLSGTVASRVFGRVVDRLRRPGADIEVEPTQYLRSTDLTTEQVRERAERKVAETLEESAKTLEEVNKLTDIPFTTTKAEASGSRAEIAVQKGREARLTPSESTQVEIRRQRNREALSDAVDNVHNNKMATNPSANPEQTAAAVQSAGTRQGDRAQDIKLSVSTFRDAEGSVDLYNWTFRSGTGRVNTKGLGKGSLAESEIGDATSGATVRVDRGNKTVTLQWIGEDAALPGSAPVLMERMLRDLEDIPSDYRWVSDNQLSPFSMNMVKELQKAGIGIRMNPGSYVKEADGVKWTYGPGREPVYEITHIPGYMMRVPLVADTAEYSSSRVADALDDDLAFLANAQARSEFWGVKLKAQIGWQPDREKSIYSVVNPRTSQLNRLATRLQARVRNALTGADTREADQTLGLVFKKTQDEEGYPILDGLTQEELDIGQLLRSRDTLRNIYERTGDEEIGAIVREIDDRLTNGRIVDNFGNDIDASHIRGTMQHANDAAETVRRSESAIASNPLFKRNADGEYVNIDLKTMGQLLSNGNKFMMHLKPWMHGNPRGVEEVQKALMSLYDDRVLSGTGFTKSKHDTFLRNFDTALKEVFSPEDLNAFRATNFTNEGKGIIADRAAKALTVMNRLGEMGPLRAGSIVEDLTAIGKTGNPAKRTKFYLKQLERINPKLAEQVRRDALEESRRMINDRFFSTDAASDPSKVAKQFHTWIKTHEDALRALHGDQYVTDLNSLWRGLHLESQRFKITAQVPLLQGDVVKTSRTLMGPLNVWQRRVSAANWIRLRWHAKKAVEAISDPDKLRALTAAKGVPIRSRPGIAAFVRAGILPGTGWDGRGEIPQDAYEKGLEFVDWLESVGEELQANETE